MVSNRPGVRRGLAWCGALVLACCLPGTAAPATLGRRVRADSRPSVPWPGGFALPAAARGRVFTAVVVADIDGDHDLDVVTVDRSLDLFVWVNDGLGHLTRREPASSPRSRLDARSRRLWPITFESLAGRLTEPVGIAARRADALDDPITTCSWQAAASPRRQVPWLRAHPRAPPAHTA